MKQMLQNFRLQVVSHTNIHVLFYLKVVSSKEIRYRKSTVTLNYLHKKDVDKKHQQMLNII